MHEFPGYQVHRELGRGAMAVVYLATQLSLKRPVALKVLDRDVDGYAGLAQRFIHEAHTLAGLCHPNIVTVHDVVESAQGEFISMEYLDGGTLGERMAKGLGLQESLAIFAQLCSALDSAHAQGVVHRDIKPENVLFRAGQTPVLADFGIARGFADDAQRVTQEGLVVGTPSYMAPEQISGEAIDGRADQYSLGAMWFEMLTGRPPFRADNTTELLYAHMARPVPSLPAALAVLQPVLERMLAKKPDDRYPDLGAAVADAGRHLLRAPELLRSPPGVAPVSPTERLHQLGFQTTGVHEQAAANETQRFPATPAPRAPTPRRWWLAGAAVAIVLAVIGFFAVRAQPQAPAAAPIVAKAAPAAPDKSIAVLPFVNMSADKEQEYFADGISEELLNQLAKVPQLRVIARTSSFAFKGKRTSVNEIASQLHVAHVLEGSIRRSGNKVRITAQLVRASDSSHLWSETYDRELTDIFAVQDEISAAVVKELKLQLLGAAPAARTVNAEAYALFLQARELCRVATPEACAQAETALKRALALEPEYAAAWAQLGLNYIDESNWGFRPVSEGSRLARSAINKALAIDPDLARAHAALGFIALAYDADLPEAARRYSRAFALAPEDDDVERGVASLAAALGRLDTAVAIHESLAARDPANSAAHGFLAAEYLHARRPDEAIASFRRELALSPNVGVTHCLLGIALLQKGEPEGALAEMKLEPLESWRRIGLALAWHDLRNAREADAALEALVAGHSKEAAYNIAYVHAYRGNTDLAFEWLDKAVAYQDPGLISIVSDPLFANIHQDPRWLPFLRKLGRAPEQLAAIKFDIAPAAAPGA